MAKKKPAKKKVAVWAKDTPPESYGPATISLPPGAIDLTKVEGADVGVIDFKKYMVGPIVKQVEGESIFDWKAHVPRRLRTGESLKAILDDLLVDPSDFIAARDTDERFKKDLDEAMRILSEMIEYRMAYLALSGTATDLKNYGPLILAKYGGSAKKSEGEQEGGADFE